jgi:hypothetical protein
MARFENAGASAALGGGVVHGINAVAYNAYDWDYLRAGADGRSGLMAPRLDGHREQSHWSR